MATASHNTRHAKMVKSGSHGKRSASFASDLSYTAATGKGRARKFQRTVRLSGQAVSNTKALAYEIAYGTASNGTV